jgi:hypothetical protein
MKSKILSNKKIAEIIAKKVYNPSLSDTEFAFQLFVEKMACPKDCKSYSEKDMKKWILKKLKKS